MTNIYTSRIEEKYCKKNNISAKPKCSSVGCDNALRFVNSTRGYGKFCCIQCSGKTNFRNQSKLNSVKISKDHWTVYEKHNADIIRMYVYENMTIRNISKSYDNITYNTVRNILLKNGVILRHLKKYDHKERWFGDNPKAKLLLNKKTFIGKNPHELMRELGVSKNSIHVYARYHDIPYPNNKSTSKPENELYEFLMCTTDNIIVKSSRTIIPPLELDLFIPELKIAIEYDGIYWHLEQMGKNKNYHLNKTNMCEKLGIKLFHIFENEWIDTTKQKIWKSILKSNFGKNDRIYARKCEIRELGKTETLYFLSENHLQGGNLYHTKCFGLIYQNEIVSLMSFGKSRFNKRYEWEILRFCNKIGTNVTGGASKLLKRFKSECNPNSLISYCDKRYSNGNLYEKLNMIPIKDSPPNYFYNFRNVELKSRHQFQKHKLSKIFDNFDPAKTEYENMLENGYDRIWDCGNKIYTWEFNT
jgi:hypothetical protein